MLKIILGFVASMMLSSAFAQTETFVMRVHDKLTNTVTYERYEHNVANRAGRIYDQQTGALLFTVREELGGRKAIMASPYGGSVVETTRPVHELRPGEETSGFMVTYANGTPPNTLSMYVKAYTSNGMIVIEAVGSAPGIVLVSRVGYRTHYRNPEWSENITHADGRKVVHDFLIRLR